MDKVLGTLVDGLVNFEADEARSKIVDDEAPAVRIILVEIEPGKRESKPTEYWLAYQTSQKKKKKGKKEKLSTVDELLYSVRNVEAVREQMLQIDGVIKMLIKVHREYNSLLPLEMHAGER